MTGKGNFPKFKMLYPPSRKMMNKPKDKQAKSIDTEFPCKQ